MVNKEDDFTQEHDDITDEDTELAAEEPELEDLEAAEGNKLQQLRTKLKDAEAAKRDALEQLAAAKADFLNAKKQLEEDKRRGIERQKIKDIEALLPLYDAFTMAMADRGAWEAIDERWRKGVEGIYQNLTSILKQHDVSTFDPTGEMFDPELHEAMGTTESEEPSDTIVQTLQHGFRTEGLVIRHAKVILSS